MFVSFHSGRKKPATSKKKGKEKKKEKKSLVTLAGPLCHLGPARGEGGGWRTGRQRSGVGSVTLQCREGPLSPGAPPHVVKRGSWEVRATICFLRKEERRCRQRQAGAHEPVSAEPPESRAPEVRGWLLGTHCGSCPPFFTDLVIFEPRVSQTGFSTLPVPRGTPPKKEKKYLFQSLFSCARDDSDSLLPS